MVTITACALIVLGLLSLLANAGVIGVPAWGVATFNNDNCEGKPVVTSPLDDNCKNISQVADFYYNNTLEISGVLAFSYDCSSGYTYVADDAACSNIFNSKIGYYANEICLKGNGISFRPVCPTYLCQPKFKLKVRACNQRIHQCFMDYNAHMKWTAGGCRNKKGKPMGDGGCQCEGYCGYTCKKACKRDPECKWSATEKACMTLDGQKGHPMPQCLGIQGQ